MTKTFSTTAWPMGAAIATGGVAPAVAGTSDDTLPAYEPNFTAGATGLDPYRGWNLSVLDGIVYIANGYDQPKRWDDGTNFYNLGAAAPANTTFTIADAGSGSTFASGITVRYYLVWRNDNTGKESAPELDANGVPGSTRLKAATDDNTITWTNPGGEWTHVGVYRAPATADTYFLVAKVAIADETYTDSTTDAVLRTKTVYRDRLRLTLPPIFEGMAPYLNRFFAWQPRSQNLEYSQPADPSGELLQEDFPPGDILPIKAEDGAGDIRAAREHNAALIVFKERATYEVTGDDPLNFTVRRLYADRGALNPRCIVEAEELMVILDHRGIYGWTPGGEPVIAGAASGTRQSKLQPIFDRMNLAAWRTFHAVHDQRHRLVKFYVALDYEPVPNIRIVYDYANDRFVSVDTAVWGGDAGHFVDAFGTIHELHGDDLGSLWEDGLTHSEGVSVGALSATVTATTLTLLTDSGAALDTTKDGALGSPYQRGTDSTDPDDTNRAYAVSATTITPYYAATANAAVNDTIWLGVIPAVAQLPKLSFQTGLVKDVIWLALEYDSGYTGTIAVLTAVDDGSFTKKDDVDMETTVRAVVVCNDKGHTWSLRFAQNAADVGFGLRGARLRVQQFATAS